MLVCSKEIREGGHQLLEKLQKYRPLIAVFNGKCKSSICYWSLNSYSWCKLILFDISGIYETFSKEIFGVKAKNLEFGLQPYKVPETETVRVSFLIRLMFLFIDAYWLDMSFYCPGLLSDAIIKPTLCPVPSCSGQSALLHQVKGAQGSNEGSGEDSRDRRDQLHIWSDSGQRWRVSQLKIFFVLFKKYKLLTNVHCHCLF